MSLKDDEIQALADIIHMLTHGGKGPHQSTHSCPCWHEAKQIVKERNDRD